MPFTPSHRRTLAASLALSVALTSARATAQAADAHYQDGVAAFAAGDYAKCIAEMNASMADKPGAKAALYLGNAHLKLGQLGLAKTSLERALELDPKTPKREALLKLIKGIEAAQTAKVRVTSDPPGAKVYVDAETEDAVLGKTPLELKLIPGSHDVYVVLEGHETEKRVREFKTGEKVVLEVPLKKKACELVLSAEPAGARASVDGGEPVALPAKVSVGLGPHGVAFTAAGFTPQGIAVDCDTSKEIPLSPKLAPVTGRLKSVAPAGLAITVDGKPVTAAALAAGLTLPPGTHEIVFSGGGRPTTRKTVVVAASEEVAVEAPATRETPPPPPQETSPYAPGVYVGLGGGANITAVEWNLGTDTKGQYPISSATAGARVGLQLGRRVAVEGEARWVGLPNRLDDGVGQGFTAVANGLYHLLPGRFTPVLEAGVGSYHVLRSDLGRDADLRLHAGLGVRGVLFDALVVRLDARDVITDGFDASLGNNVELLLGVEAFLGRKR